MTQYSMRIKSPMRTHVRQIRGTQNPVCVVCGLVWTPEDKEKEPDCVTRHMIEKHGFKRVGAQVFQSIPCVACTKPGLYKIGAIAYCKEHLHLGQPRRDYINRELNRGGDDDYQRQLIKRDKTQAFDRQNRHRSRRG